MVGWFYIGRRKDESRTSAIWSQAHLHSKTKRSEPHSQTGVRQSRPPPCHILGCSAGRSGRSLGWTAGSDCVSGAAGSCCSTERGWPPCCGLTGFTDEVRCIFQRLKDKRFLLRFDLKTGFVWTAENFFQCKKIVNADCWWWVWLRTIWSWKIPLNF